MKIDARTGRFTVELESACQRLENIRKKGSGITPPPRPENNLALHGQSFFFEGGSSHEYLSKTTQLWTL